MISTNSSLHGEVVAWEVKAKETPFALVRDAAQKSGIPEELLKDLKPRSAFSRACKDLKKDRVIRKVKDEDEKIVFQFTQESLVGSKFEYVYEASLILDKDTGRVTADEYGAEELAKHAEELVAHAMKTRTAQDITGIVKKAFQNHADLFPIVPSKGVAYFVPEEHREFTNRMREFLKEIGGTLHGFPVPKGTEQGNQSVKQAVESGLTAMLEELEEAAKLWDPDKTRASTTEKSVERWQLINHKLEAYETYLGDAVQRMKAKARVTKQKLANRILELEEERTKEQEEASGNTVPVPQNHAASESQALFA